MADRVYTAQLQMTADVSQAKSQLSSLQSSLNQILTSPTSSRVGQTINKDFTQALKTVNQLKAAIANATNINTGKLDISKFSQSLATSKMTLQDYGNQLNSLGPKGQRAFMQLAQSIATAEVPIKKTNSLMKDLAITMGNTIKWQLSSGLMHGFIGALKTSYGYAQDLDASLNNIRIVTGQSTDQMAKFALEANKAAKALSTTTNDFTKASLIYYQQGLNDAQVKARTEITTKMANVTKETAQEVSDYMTAIWNNFDDGSKSLEYYADVMTALGAATASSTDEIATGLEKFAAVAETVGLSYEYATSALATITAETRQNADIVGNALKTLFSRIQGLNLGETLDDGTTLNKYSQALDKIGIDIKDANGEIKNMDVILNELGNKWGTLSKDTQIATAQTVAGVRQYTQLIALMSNWSTFQENLNTALTSTGELDRQAEIYAESWEASSKRVRAAAEGVWDSIMDENFFIGVNNTLEDTLSVVERLIDALGGMPGLLSVIGIALTKNLGSSITSNITRMINNIPILTGGAAKSAETMRNDANTILTGMKINPEDELVLGNQLHQAQYSNIITSGLANGTISEEQAAALRANADTVNYLSQQRQKAYARQIEVSDNNLVLAAAVDDAGINRRELEKAVNDDLNYQNALNQDDKTFYRRYYNSRGNFTGNAKERLGIDGETEGAFKLPVRKKGESTDEYVQKYSKEIATAREEIKKFDGTTKNITKSTDQFINNLEGGKEAAREYANGLRNANKAQQDKIQIDKSYEQAVKETDDLMKDPSKLLDPVQENIKTFSSGITSTLQGTAQLAMGFVSLRSAIQALNNEDLSFGEKLTSVLMSVGLGLPAVMNGLSAFKTGIINIGNACKAGLIPNLIASSLGLNNLEGDALKTAIATRILTKEEYNAIVAKNADTAATGGLTLATELYNKALQKVKANLGKTVLIIAIVVAAVTTLVAIVKHFQDISIDGQIKRTNQAIEEMSTVLSDAKNEVQELVAAFDNYNSIVDKLESCTKGTKEYRDALYEANQAAIELLQKHPEIASKKGAVKYTDDRVIITEEGQQAILEDQQNAVTALTYGSYSLQQNLRGLQIEKQEEALRNAFMTGFTGHDGYGFQGAQANLINDLAKSMYEDEVFNSDKFERIYNNALRENNLGENLLNLNDAKEYAESLYNSNKELQKAIEENTLQTKIENDNITRQALGEDAENMSEDEIRLTSNLMNQAKQDIVDSIIEEKNFTGEEGSKDGINRWSTANDEQVKALWQRYMAAIDEDYQLASNPVRGNDTNRTFAYIGADNKVAEVSIKTMANAIAAAEALEKLDEYTNKAAETLALFDQNAGAAANGLKGYIANQNFSTMTQNDFEFMKSEINKAGSLESYYLNTLGLSSDQLLQLANSNGFEGDTAVADYLSQQQEIIYGQTDKFDNTGKSKYFAVTNAIQSEQYTVEGGGLAGFTWYENAGWYKEFDENVQSQITTSLENAFELAGQNGINTLSKVLSTLDPDEMEGFLSVLNGFDWTQDGAQEEFIRLLGESGVNIYKNKDALNAFAGAAENAGNKLPIADLDTLISQLGEILELVGEINLGDIVDQETIDKLREAGIIIDNYFNKGANGKYINVRELSPEDAVEATKNEVAKKGNAFDNLGLNATGKVSYTDYITGDRVSTSQAEYQLNQTEAGLKNDSIFYYKWLVKNDSNPLFANLGEEESMAIFGKDLEAINATLAGNDAEAIKEIFNQYRQFLIDGIAGGYTEEAINEEGMLAAAQHEDSTIHTLNNQEDFKNADGSFTETGIGALENFAAGKEKYHDAYQDYLKETEGIEKNSEKAAKAAEDLEKRIKNIDANEAAQSIGELVNEIKKLPKESEETENAFRGVQEQLEKVFGKNVIDENYIKNNLDKIQQWAQGNLTSEDLFKDSVEYKLRMIPDLDYDAIQMAFDNVQDKEVFLRVIGEGDFTDLAAQLLSTGADAASVANILAAIGQTTLTPEQFNEMFDALQAMSEAMGIISTAGLDRRAYEAAGAKISAAKAKLGSMGFDATYWGEADPYLKENSFGSVSNGYTGSGGGGSSGSDKTGKEQLQEKQMEVYENKRKRLAAQRENMNPEDASKYIKEEIELLEKEQKILEKQIKTWKTLMKEKVEEFNEKYPEFEIKLTDDGEIANLAEIYAAMEAKYDELMATKGIDHAEEWHKEMMDALDLPVGLQENIDENVAILADKEKEQAELALQEITDRIDWRIKQIDFEIKKLNYYQEKLLIQAHGNKQTIEAMLAGFQYQEQEMLQLFEKGAALRQGIAELKAAKAQYPGNEQIFDEAILDYQSDLVDLNLDILKLRQEMEELVQNVLDLALDEMDIQNERIEKYVSMLDHFQNIIDLSGRSMLDQELKVQIGATKVETLIDKMGIAKQKMEGLMEATKLAEEALAKRKADGDTTSVKFWENQVEVLKRELEAASEEFLGTWEDALTAASELFEMRVELAVQTLSDALSPFSSLEILQDRYNKEKEIQDQYLDDATRLYELNKLNREINQSIMDENDLLARSKLRDIQEEILALQKAGVEMSQYDLDVLQKKYDLRLAEIALMEAQNSKTSMRLIRDAAGNWTYAYDADEQAIEDATQKYEDAVYALDQLAKEYVNDVSNQLIEIQIEYKEALGEVDRNASDYQEQLLALQEHYMERYRYMLDELKKGADDQGLAFHETLYGQMMDLATYEDAYNQFVNNSDVTITELMTNYKDWQKVVEQAMNVAGTSWEDFGTDMDGTLMSLEEHIQALCDEISELVDVLMGYVAEAIGMVEEWQAKYSKRVDQELAANEAAFGSGLGGGGGKTTEVDMVTDWANVIYELSSGKEEVYDAWGNLVTDIDYAIAQREAKVQAAKDGATIYYEYSAKDDQPGLVKMEDPQRQEAIDTPTDAFIKVTVTSGATGMYTGDWPISEGMDEKGGKLALLHRKELVLNQTDTANILDAVIDFVVSIIQVN